MDSQREYSAHHASPGSAACRASNAALASGPVGAKGSDTRMLLPPSSIRVTRLPTAFCSRQNKGQHVDLHSCPSQQCRLPGTPLPLLPATSTTL